MRPRALVFLDASVLVAASRSPSGGSSVAIKVCRGLRFRAAVSARVMLESRVNVAEKFAEADLVRFYQLIADLDPELAPSPRAESLARCTPLVGKDDAHVPAAALECGAGYLLSLDRRHLITSAANSAGLPLKVMTPGEFLKEITSTS